MNEKMAVLLLAYGSPDSLDDIEAYLSSVRGGRETPLEVLEEVRAHYAAIGGKSPLLDITLRQGKALEKELNRDLPDSARVFIGMRHWRPTIATAVEQIAGEDIPNVTALCMTPFSSQMTTGAYYTQLRQAIDAQGSRSTWRNRLTLRMAGPWFDHPGFIQASARNVRNGLAKVETAEEKPAVIFSAHSLPAALAEQGDPYPEQFTQLCNLAANAAGLSPDDWFACYQSAGSKKMPWLGPSLEDTIRRLAADGRKSVLVAPIGFVCDHVEILYDIDIKAKRLAAQLGLEMIRTASLNDQPGFISALADIVRSHREIL